METGKTKLALKRKRKRSTRSSLACKKLLLSRQRKQVTPTSDGFLSFRRRLFVVYSFVANKKTTYTLLPKYFSTSILNEKCRHLSIVLVLAQYSVNVLLLSKLLQQKEIFQFNPIANRSQLSRGNVSAEN